ncbi:amino acid ABC transporter permease [Rhizobium sp. RMa-01]|uniref:amino acid ABC transporter permease n=1 Tax=unclassified Rhizobium TaxID=2613769 RepID=UPI000E2EFB16|nr:MULTISPECIES: amino acid ABC transporter permease [unclassified Rhizobium]RVU10002.1 amino acid ABC transporter permease [Rhizobium sp. RMa-01]
MFDTALTRYDVVFMLKGAGTTLIITFWAVLGGTFAGLVLGLVRASAPTWVNAPIGAVLDVFRSIPLLIQFVMANSLKSVIGLNWAPFTIACVMLAIYTAAYCTEIVRAGVQAVPPNTRRASRSLGMTWSQDLTNIVFPIALRTSLPGWIGLTLSVMKDTALVSWIGIMELLRASQSIITRIQEPMFILLITGLIYFAISFPIGRLGARLEKKWQEND